MLGGLLFGLVRFWEVITLLPVIGMLAWFVHGYVVRNLLTPNSILILFITSVLACAWAVATWLNLNGTRRNALVVAFVDLLFVGAFIASDYFISPVGSSNCSNFSASGFYYTLGPFGYAGRVANDSAASNLGGNCSMLKACYAFSIMNTIFFFFSSILAVFLHRNQKTVVVKEVRRTRHSTRRGSGSRSRRSSSRRGTYMV